MTTTDEPAVEVPVHTEDLAADVAGLWKVYRSGRTRPLKWRLEQLDGLLALLREHEDEIVEAMQTDFGKPSHEAYATDIGGVICDIRFIRKNLASWMSARKLRTPLTSQPAKSRLYPEPWGAVLLFPAWNYPVGLTALPLAGALAAGNSVAIKPAEMAPSAAALLVRLLPRVAGSSSCEGVRRRPRSRCGTAATPLGSYPLHRQLASGPNRDAICRTSSHAGNAGTGWQESCICAPRC
jgi:aldehyde dehydrogenase (NAD+)